MSLHPRHVGIELREARERRGLTLRQVANSTRISIAALEALEAGHIARLPGGIFSRAFVRAYAQEVGLDPEEAVRQFVEEFPVDAVTIGSPLVADPADVGDGLDAEFRPWPGVAIIAGAVVVILLGLSWAVMWWRGSVDAAASSESPLAIAEPARPPVAASPAPASAATTSAPSSQPAAATPSGDDAEPPPAVQPPPTDAPAPVNGLRLTLTPDALCWVRIIADGRSAYEGMLTRGDTQTVEAKRSLVVTVGDAAACRYTVNGRPGRPLGRPGQVVTARLTPDTARGYMQ